MILTSEQTTQGSEEWKALRKTKITASDAATIMGLNPWMTREQLLEEKLGLRPEREVNSRMQRGIILEPEARRYYEKMTGNLMVADVKIHPQIDWIMASLDGISIDEKLILEIKCTHKKNHYLASNGKIPSYYFPQIQHQIFCCGVDVCDYFSYNDDDPVLDLGIVVVVKRDDEFIKRMIEMEFDFYQEMQDRLADIEMNEIKNK
jgi:putative phage-type endonuclease